MRSWILLLAIILLFFSAYQNANAGGKTSISIGAGNNTNLTGASIPWNDGGGIAAYFELAHEWELSEQLSMKAQWIHLSQWNAGSPFNNNIEASVDHLGVAIKWTF